MLWVATIGGIGWTEKPWLVDDLEIPRIVTISRPLSLPAVTCVIWGNDERTILAVKKYLFSTSSAQESPEMSNNSPIDPFTTPQLFTKHLEVTLITLPQLNVTMCLCINSNSEARLQREIRMYPKVSNANCGGARSHRS